MSIGEFNSSGGKNRGTAVQKGFPSGGRDLGTAIGENKPKVKEGMTPFKDKRNVAHKSKGDGGVPIGKSGGNIGAKVGKGV